MNAENEKVQIRNRVKQSGRPKAIEDEVVWAYTKLNPNKTVKEIANHFGIGEATVYRSFERMPKDYMQGEIEPTRFELYPIVEEWLNRRKMQITLGQVKEGIVKAQYTLLERAWLLLGRRNPKAWTPEDIMQKVLSQLSEGNRFNMLIAIRSLRPELQQELSTKGFKETKQSVEYMITWRNTIKRLISNGSLNKLLDAPNLRDETLLYTHITLGSREGEKTPCGILHIDWKNVHWDTKTIDVYKSKTGRGFYWLDCPLDLFGEITVNLLKEYWEFCGKPKEGRIFPITYPQLRQTYIKAGQRCNEKLTPHFARKLHVSLLWKMGVPLELVAGEKPHGYFGCGWEDLATLKKYYSALSTEKLQENRQKAKGGFCCVDAVCVAN